MKSFLLKVKHFFKRNVYPITVTVCTVLILGIITISAYSSIKESGTNVVKQTINPIDEKTAGVDDPSDPVSPINSTDTIIFNLPFENASISKEYTDSSLIYDNTTKLWCTHQALDFACEEGKKVAAVFDGKIEKIENSMMNGTVVYLRVSEELVVIYKGLSSDISVKEGETVKKGRIIGTVSSFLAEKADGVHLHLELEKSGKLIDPTEYFSFNK